MMDEFALHKGQSYATVFADAETRQVLWVGKGRNRADVSPFFERLGKRRCKKIRAVAMDMSTTFELEVREHCPNAEIVLDQFHVVANYGHQVIDRIRVNEANRCRDDKAARELIKGAKFKVLKRIAYGYRDEAYFFLKIRAAFPGHP